MPDISKIKLPSGNEYDIKDAVARQTIAGGIAFIVAWDGSSTPVAADIPAGVVVTYNDASTTGTLATTSATTGAFYLVKSATTPSSEAKDIYDEYVVIKPNTSDNTTWFWEKIGDTRINLSNIVTEVTLSKSTDTAIGTDATFTITQPTVTLASNNSSGDVQVATGGSASSTTNTDWLKGISVTDEVLTISAATLSQTYLGATASGANTAWNSKDSVTVLTNSSDISVTKGS